VYVRKVTLVSLVALDLFLVTASMAMIALHPGEGLPEGVWWKSVAAADGGGGSTVPIPPPERPTPRTPNGTAAETPTPSGVLIDLTLADIGLRILPEPNPLAEQQVAFLFPPPPESGIDWRATPPPGEGGVLTITLAAGKVPGALRIELGPLQINGQEAIAAVLGIELDVGPLEVERTGFQPGIVRLIAELDRLPPRILIDVQDVLYDSGMIAAVNEAANMVDMGVVAVAHAAKIDTNLAAEIASATIEMAVDKGWAKAWPSGRVLVARLGQDGNGHVLKTTPLPEDASRLSQFRAESPEGFSTFILVALGEMTTRERESGPSASLWVGVGLGAVGLVGLAMGAFILMSSQRRRRDA
jgi:hypothetical protein